MFSNEKISEIIKNVLNQEEYKIPIEELDLRINAGNLDKKTNENLESKN